MSPSPPTPGAARFDLSGQVAVVTGGTRGIGAAITRALLASGARVLATYVANQQAAEELRDSLDPEQVERLGLHRFDVADPEAVRAFFAGLDTLHIMVNNAAIRRDGPLGLMSLESWQRVLAVNLEGAFHTCKAAVRAMMAHRYGRIINIASPSGLWGLAGQANYAAAKAGLIALTRSLALEVASRGITANCVTPGYVETELLAGLPEKRLAEMRAEVPMARFGRPEEIAAAVLFLASAEASYITGANLMVSGGI
jgi:3-oxoacyl-[acyl-carrier protein] reductase